MNCTSEFIHTKVILRCGKGFTLKAPWSYTFEKASDFRWDIYLELTLLYKRVIGEEVPRSSVLTLVLQKIFKEPSPIFLSSCLRTSSVRVKRRKHGNRRGQLLLAGDSRGVVPVGFFGAALGKSHFLKSLGRLRHPTWEAVPSLLFPHVPPEPQPGCALQEVPNRSGKDRRSWISAAFYHILQITRVLSGSRCILKLWLNSLCNPCMMLQNQ